VRGTRDSGCRACVTCSPVSRLLIRASGRTGVRFRACESSRQGATATPTAVLLSSVRGPASTAGGSGPCLPERAAGGGVDGQGCASFMELWPLAGQPTPRRPFGCQGFFSTPWGPLLKATNRGLALHHCIRQHILIYAHSQYFRPHSVGEQLTHNTWKLELPTPANQGSFVLVQTHHWHVTSYFKCQLNIRTPAVIRAQVRPCSHRNKVPVSTGLLPSSHKELRKHDEHDDVADCDG
jgi:hypothetical protein